MNEQGKKRINEVQCLNTKREKTESDNDNQQRIIPRTEEVTYSNQKVPPGTQQYEYNGQTPTFGASQ